MSNYLRLALIRLGLVAGLFIVIACVIIFRLPPEVICESITDSQEKKICMTPELSLADKKLNVAYQKILAALSSEGKIEFEKSQLAWLNFRKEACGYFPNFPKDTARSIDSNRCLIEAYSNRQRKLDNTLFLGGKIVIYSVDHYVSEKYYPIYSGFPMRLLAYPKMDTQNSDNDKWNTEMQKDVDPSGIGFEAWLTSNSFVNYEIASVTPDIISIRFEDYHYSDPKTKNEPYWRTYNWVRRENRLMTAEDLFDSNKDWQSALGKLCLDIIVSRIKDPEKHTNVINLKYVTESFSSVEYWLIKPEGLSIKFPPFSFQSLSEQFGEIVIPWELLKPYTNNNIVYSMPPINF